MILDICCIFTNWIEDGGVCVEYTFDQSGIIHDDRQEVRDWVGGGKEVGQDNDQDYGLDRSEPHGLGNKEPDVALVILRQNV